jgi:hypothetical protein
MNKRYLMAPGPVTVAPEVLAKNLNFQPYLPGSERISNISIKRKMTA